ncbi:hypothetical protein PHYBLDRAFT_64694 [Phycomyces blakesleeanus NRRL 1555(-)]|uniref:Uncharacterized protein n=1 Tax=Phycomyces blakesleeanus (strain ATCC 8743b / DSM 1359 / FGSC 10004 / NBRC 33097 / NRRL 1555) TaxID=763407 RepID=A0A162PKP4_PHYB8|nr:hypothetical protein PHYBLDRAFT_64694 [Phycomyces blakesleeanus NRRL 1555(-)]OAD73737.1 hypothetical protein PHYBLDRAFT_64694 [Phycomyces blakesleeanus NRRL 1555(-)]|eukprot:XP_018291777.1 hypothetical protein PHYBLDRAFT_64694 [Phycomyces blakesleeanus NRRL 1555(-)]
MKAHIIISLKYKVYYVKSNIDKKRLHTFALFHRNICTKQQTIDALKKSRKISEFIVKKNTGRVFIASIDELIKNILEVIKKEVNVKLEQMAAVKELEKNLKANKYIHKVDNVLSDLESKERTLGFFESLGIYSFKEEIRMCKRLFYICYKNL